MADLERRETRGWEVLELTTDAIAVTRAPRSRWRRLVPDPASRRAELLRSTPWGLPAYGAPILPGDSEAQAMSTFGGWQTLFPNGGDAVDGAGRRVGASTARRALTPLDWEYTGTSLIMNGRLRHTPFSLTRTISLRGHELSLGETVRNVGRERDRDHVGQPAHPGWRPAGSGHRARRRRHRGPSRPPVRRVRRATTTSARGRVRRGRPPWSTCAPCPAPTPNESRLAYLSDLTRPWLRVTRPERRLGLDLEWDEQPLAARVVPAGGGRPERLPLVRRRLLPQPHPVHQLAGARAARGPPGRREHPVDPGRSHPYVVRHPDRAPGLGRGREQ